MIPYGIIGTHEIDCGPIVSFVCVYKVFNFRQHYRLNRLVVLLVALLLSNVAALACATAYALCVDCSEHPPVACADLDPCATVDVISSKVSTDVLDTTFRPIVSAPAPITSEPVSGLASGGVAENKVTDLAPSSPLNLLFCVFLL